MVVQVNRELGVLDVELRRCPGRAENNISGSLGRDSGQRLGAGKGDSLNPNPMTPAYGLNKVLDQVVAEAFWH